VKILVVEDDVRLAHDLRGGFVEQGFEVQVAHTLAAADEAVQRAAFHAILLDLGLPDGCGATLLRSLRKAGNRTPVIVATARGETDHRVSGLEDGADDYVVKPYAFAELVARVRAVLRRSADHGIRLVAVEDLTLDIARRRVSRSGREIPVSPREFDLLLYLANHAGLAVSREMLARDVWGVTSRATPIDNVIDVSICRLRAKLNESGEANLLHTIRGVGYALGRQAEANA
jgi:two-component system, OmpR family, copper resistance phosphate regulon response regulator CusR